jgi:phage shock protein PspC (stress-responsive transcriptional regulator)/uncharacterized membrane protein
MKDITRIHIAKTPYNVEVSAKKSLEAYIAAIESYATDSELLEDIEIRMTELLLERGVRPDEVISEADVTAVREQLGEPKDFMSDAATLGIDTELLSKGKKRKLYRDLDNALLGGVLSGFASFFGINVLWVRLLFIILSFMSFGFALVIYAVLWLIIPSARTAAERLQMAGLPVTLASIRELNEDGSNASIKRRVGIQKRIATIILGLIGIGGAIASATALVSVVVMFTQRDQGGWSDSFVSYQLAIILAFAAGVLLMILCMLVAFASFAQKFNKRIWVSAVIIVVLGLGLFSAAYVSALYNQQLRSNEIQRNTIDMNLKMPANFTAAKSLLIDVSHGNVVYIADDTTTSIKQRSYKDAAKAAVTVNEGVIKVQLAATDWQNSPAGTTITVYGPRLDSIVVTHGDASYSGANQAKLNVEVHNTSSLRLYSSRIDMLTVKADASAQLSASEAAVADVKISAEGQASIGLGNIKTLDVISPDVCASDGTARISIGNIVSALYVLNGINVAVKSAESPCLQMVFNGDQQGLPRYHN